MSGIDISIFTAHSTRMASTSKAAAMGVGLQTILKTTGWHGAQNFKKFYHREEMPAEKEFFIFDICIRLVICTTSNWTVKEHKKTNLLSDQSKD